jgi:hypothetical protein
LFRQVASPKGEFAFSCHFLAPALVLNSMQEHAGLHRSPARELGLGSQLQTYAVLAQRLAGTMVPLLSDVELAAR